MIPDKEDCHIYEGPERGPANWLWPITGLVVGFGLIIWAVIYG